MHARVLPGLLSFALLVVTVRGAETFDEAMARATVEYGARLRQASDELTQVRERIARDKAPLLKAMRAAEDRIIAADTEITRLETATEHSLEDHRKALRDADALRKNVSYLSTLAHDSLKAYGEGLAPGEEPLLAERLQSMQQKLDAASIALDGMAAAASAEFLQERMRLALGGYTAPGSSMLDDSNLVVKGTFAFVGPETFFRAEQSGDAGTVRSREGSDYPITYRLAAWKPDAAEAFFGGRLGTIMADASAGKALRLKETKGTIWEHINKGGMIAYAILGVGLLSAFMILQKMHDLSQMAVDKPEAVQRFVAIVARGARAEAQQAVGSLQATTRELYTVGLRHIDQPKEILEEYLYAVLLRQRLHYERRLPLLAVIAVASPLMGLLGTVTGMVRTFALITVFGTGNAGKLAGGISEVLVATELGLMVAIPTLVAHGFLAHRIQKNLSLLERYAVEFVAAAQSAKTAVHAGEPVRT
jgi:biopolymer transport protein ExbB